MLHTVFLIFVDFINYTEGQLVCNSGVMPVFYSVIGII